MQESAVPAKFPIPFANAAGAGYARPIPVASQVGINPGWASLTDGFPPQAFQPQLAGGVPPFGQDFNGLLNQITAWIRWLSAGGPVQWDAAFAAAVGGYPAGAIVASSVTAGLYFECLTDNNTTNPDTGGAGWKGFVPTGGSVAYYVDSGAPNAMAITPAPALAAYSDGLTFYVKPSNANTGATTINVNGLGAVGVLNPDGSAVAAGKVQPGQLMLLTFIGGAFQWLNSPSGAAPASAAQIWAGSDNSSFVTAKSMVDSMAPAALTDASPIAWNMNNGFNAAVQLTAAVGATRMVQNPTNPKLLMPVSLSLKQPASGGPCAVTWDTAWDFGKVGFAGLNTGANKEDSVFGTITSLSPLRIKANLWQSA